VAERDAAVHAAGALLAEVIFDGSGEYLQEVADPLGRIAIRHGFASKFLKAGRFAHVTLDFNRFGKEPHAKAQRRKDAYHSILKPQRHHEHNVKRSKSK
jgi:hypothetical protein